MTDCLFCKIIAGEIPSQKVYEDDRCLAFKDIAPLAQYNIDKVNEIAGHILDFCAAPHTFEEVLQHLFTSYDLAMTFEQYALVGSTVRNYLSWLLDSERLSATFTDNRLLWQRV